MIFILSDIAEQVISIIKQENKNQAGDPCLPGLCAPSLAHAVYITGGDYTFNRNPHVTPYLRTGQAFTTEGFHDFTVVTDFTFVEDVIGQVTVIKALVANT